MATVLRLGNVSPVQGHRLDDRADAAPIALAAARARGADLKTAMREAQQAVDDVVEAPTGELVHRRPLAAFEVNPELAAELGGRNVVEYVFPDGMEPGEALTNVQRTWETYHSDDPPEWVEGDGDDGDLLAALVARTYTWPKSETRDEHKCRVGRPRGWKGLEHDRGTEA
jgi:hypothetical protein